MGSWTLQTAPLMSYRPDLPFDPGTEEGKNPRLVHYDGENSGWRPQAMIAGPEGKIYIGAVAGPVFPGPAPTASSPCRPGGAI